MATNPYKAPEEAKRTASCLNQVIRWLPFALGHTAIPVILGTLFVTTTLNVSLPVLLIWLVVVIVASCRHFKAGRTRTGLATVSIESFVMAAIVVGACLAPVKITDRVLASHVTLPRTEMTLGKLCDFTGSYREDWPISVSMSVPEDDDSLVIRFPARRITVRRFVEAVETQSSLRHRFSHCGSCSTILWGGSCTFGLNLRDPKRRFH